MTVVHTSGPADPAGPLADLLTAAFVTDATADWLVPDPVERLAVYRRYWAVIAEHALTAATVHLIPGADGTPVGAALWYDTPAGALPDLAPPDYDTRLSAACGEHTDGFAALDAAMHHAYPADVDGYAYLGFVAVAPEHQGRGTGRALLTHHHRDLDAAGRPAFLIASSARSARLYARLGYRPHGPDLPLPNGGPTYHPMLRPPRVW